MDRVSLFAILSVRKTVRSLGFFRVIAVRKGCAHLDVSSYQVGRLFVCLQGDVDGGERPAGHLLHLSQQLLGRRRKKKRSVKVSDWSTQTVYYPIKLLNMIHQNTVKLFLTD